MFNREQFLQKHGWVEVPDDASEATADYADDLGSPMQSDTKIVDSPIAGTADLQSDQALIRSVADEFARARRTVRGSEPPAQRDGLEVPPGGNVEIINVLPAASADRSADPIPKSGPGRKGIVIDGDRGIIGMQG